MAILAILQIPDPDAENGSGQIGPNLGGGPDTPKLGSKQA